MEKYNISLFHKELNPIVSVIFSFLNAEVGLVDLVVGIRMLIELAFVALRNHMKATIFLGGVLKGSPGSHDPVSRAEWEVSKVLV